MSTISDITSFLNTARDATLAVDQAFTYGTTGASPTAMAQDSAKFNALNGSGAVDPAGQVSDASTRSPALNAIAGNNQKGPPWQYIAIAVLGVLVLFAVFRRK